MTIMLGDPHAALIDAGADEALAAKAAQEVAAYDSDIGNLKRDMLVLKLMVGGVFAILLPVLWLVLRIGAKLGALPIDPLRGSIPPEASPSEPRCKQMDSQGFALSGSRAEPWPLTGHVQGSQASHGASAMMALISQ